MGKKEKRVTSSGDVLKSHFRQSEAICTATGSLLLAAMDDVRPTACTARLRTPMS